MVLIPFINHLPLRETAQFSIENMIYEGNEKSFTEERFDIDVDVKWYYRTMVCLI